MKNNCVRILSAFFVLAALAITAKGQVPDRLVVNIPYDSVVDGKTLPAGAYRIHRVSDSNERVLVISNSENREAVLVLSSEVVVKTGAEQPSVSFRHVGEQHLLSKIETGEHVFTFPVSNPR